MSERVLCPTCGGKMVVLFRSSVCDYCNPIQPQAEREWWEEFSSRPVQQVSWLSYFEGAATKVADSQYVVLLSKADALKNTFGTVYFFKLTNPLGITMWRNERQVTAKCLAQLYNASYHRSHQLLQTYFYKENSRYDQVSFLKWKK